MARYSLITAAFLIFASLFYSCTNRNTENKNSISKLSQVDSIIGIADSIDNLIAKNEIKFSKVVYSEDTSKILTMFYNNGQAVKLICPNFGYGGLLDSNGQFYFDRNGYVFLKKLKEGKDSFSYQYLGFVKHHTYVDITRNMKKLDEAKELSFGMECDLIQEVDYFMRFFQGLGHYKICSCADTNFDYKMEGDSTALYEKPDSKSKLLKYILGDFQYNYIERSQQVFHKGAEPLFMVKIKTQGGDTGWIYMNAVSGQPSN